MGDDKAEGSINSIDVSPTNRRRPLFSPSMICAWGIICHSLAGACKRQDAMMHIKYLA